jgi:hypothetical protein
MLIKTILVADVPRDTLLHPEPKEANPGKP